jgi:hypothetical protein
VAQPAPASSAELRFLTLVRWSAVKSADKEFPLSVLGLALRLLGDTSIQAVRDDEMSELRTYTAILASELKKLYPSATEVVMAMRLPHLIASSMLPRPLTSQSGMRDDIVEDSIVGARYNSAARSTQEVIEAQRIRLLARVYATVGAIVATFETTTDATNALLQLAAQLAPNVKGSLVVLMAELERVLHPQEEVILQIIRDHPDRLGAAVVDMLLRELEMTSSRADSRGDAPGSSGGSGGTEAALNVAALSRPRPRAIQ